jgi:hypothetical protein
MTGAPGDRGRQRATPPAHAPVSKAAAHWPGGVSHPTSHRHAMEAACVARHLARAAATACRRAPGAAAWSGCPRGSAGDVYAAGGRCRPAAKPPLLPPPGPIQGPACSPASWAAVRRPHGRTAAGTERCNWPPAVRVVGALGPGPAAAPAPPSRRRRPGARLAGGARASRARGAAAGPAPKPAALPCHRSFRDCRDRPKHSHPPASPSPPLPPHNAPRRDLARRLRAIGHWGNHWGLFNQSESGRREPEPAAGGVLVGRGRAPTGPRARPRPAPGAGPAAPWRTFRPTRRTRAAPRRRTCRRLCSSTPRAAAACRRQQCRAPAAQSSSFQTTAWARRSASGPSARCARNARSASGGGGRRGVERGALAQHRRRRCSACAARPRRCGGSRPPSVQHAGPTIALVVRF